MKIRVATYNIHKGVSAIRRRSRLHELRLALHHLDADVVFLQEVQEHSPQHSSHGRPPGAPGALDFLASSGYAHLAYGANAVYPHGHHGNAILSRLPIARHENHDVSDHALEHRGVLHAVVRDEAGGPEMHLLCTHFGLARRSRERQAQWLCEFIGRVVPPDALLLVAGDFNDWQHAVDGHMRRIGLVEAFDAVPRRHWLEPFIPGGRSTGLARTFPSFAPWLSLDRIYLRGLRPVRARVLQGSFWRRCSDHAPLVAEFESP
jgi:endonuclease/exonuclease/phosphatase family metal-dependent hydrolase